MKRTKTKKSLPKPDAIFTGDMHVRLDQPICRKDDFQETFWRKFSWLMGFNAPVIHSGDLFHHWKPAPELLSKFIQRVSDKFHTIYGNHDLPQHSLELKEKCGVFTLEAAGAVKVMPGCHWGEEPTEPSIVIKGRKILVWHIGTYKGKEPYPGCPDSPGARLLKKYPDYDVILTGHNHKPFTIEKDGRLLVNPGSISRQAAAEADYKPRVWFYYADTNTVKEVFVPIADGVVEDVITTEHLEEKKEREQRINAFVSKLDTSDIATTLSFEDNLQRALAKNKVKKEVQNIIHLSIE